MPYSETTGLNVRNSLTDLPWSPSGTNDSVPAEHRPY